MEIDRMLSINNELHDLLNQTDEMQRNCVHVGRMECSLLKYLSYCNQAACMNDLAAKLEVSHSRITRIVDTLVRKGYVERFCSSDDRRKWFARITETGKQTVEESRSRQREFFERILRLVPETHVPQVMDALEEYIVAYKQNLQKEVVE
jgi:DNA-binding MarR family transcriptional regulator